jgi:hypothetical protein
VCTEEGVGGGIDIELAHSAVILQRLPVGHVGVFFNRFDVRPPVRFIPITAVIADAGDHITP